MTIKEVKLFKNTIDQISIKQKFRKIQSKQLMKFEKQVSPAFVIFTKYEETRCTATFDERYFHGIIS